ncbi:manganese efflux pump MntP family protein [Clostridium uliginosum]|uniref:Putative manganese efflux pump MntP n=1 Tax=Clostridium uliginosum TaxID=119641 RepID=A0A1I1J8W5_9CLOT|nr:manganese efflux pump MntP family protein [Clostridium uliginosum]SFC43048.1 Putative Mn2+ efflux pump MntP [Clostridium uliginosum]
MSIVSIIFISIGLAMDAFAVSLTTGLKVTKEEKRKIALKAGMYFGGFQALMPLIGWILGIGFNQYIQQWDHWISFILLTIIGGKMIYESINGKDDDNIDIHSSKRFLMLAIATSIDALAVGISFAFLNVNILIAVFLIGIITFITSWAAVYIGKIFGELLKDKAEIIGGVILILMGIQILVEHLGLLEKLI